MFEGQQEFEEACWDFLQRARGGSTEALGSLLQMFEAPLLKYARRELPDELRGRMSGSDLFQDAVVCAVQKFPEFSGNNAGAIFNWLFRILQNTLRKRLRDNRRDKRDAARDVALPEGDAEPAVPGPAPDEQAVLGELQRCLCEVMAALPEADEQRLRLHFCEGLSLEAIAAQEGCSTGAVRHRCRAALRKLRAHLTDEDGQARTQPPPSTRAERSSAYLKARKESFVHAARNGATVPELALLTGLTQRRVRQLLERLQSRQNTAGASTL